MKSGQRLKCVQPRIAAQRLVLMRHRPKCDEQQHKSQGRYTAQSRVIRRIVGVLARGRENFLISQLFQGTDELLVVAPAPHGSVVDLLPHLPGARRHNSSFGFVER